MFTFNNQFYKQTFGTSMGNPLSPFIANLFLSNLETKLKQQSTSFPKVWFRYVDDIFAIVDKDFYIDNFTDVLNNQYPSIKFTYEVENNSQLPFLDIKILNKNNILFDIYRKPTHTDNYIHIDSCVPWKTKMSAFNSLIYRLINIPLTKEFFDKELNKIYEIAELNGYNRSVVSKLLNKHNSKKRLSSTTLTTAKSKDKFKSFTFHPTISNKFNNIFKKHNITPVFRSNYKIKNLLGNTFDKIPDNQKSGIYKIECADCNLCYVGQTKRNILTRYKEHLSHVKYSRPEKSALAEHAITKNHSFSAQNLTLLKQSAHFNLNTLEAIEMYKSRDILVNNDLSPIENNPLLPLIDRFKGIN